ncbi:rho GTPase activating protein 22 [Mycena belliarum]|uniref:Rho GTPase activating protein 22 n=1 Tax=Mycena belliarum TaxID=1033014 RepID=A0AAD6TW79_9AGAR|nr:rho GTPase activating protein 22 [Mycena belliae]
MPIRVDTQLSFVDKIAVYRGRADSASGTAEGAYTSGSAMLVTSSYTSTPLTTVPQQEMVTGPVPFYARRRTDSERSGRSTSGRSGRSGETSPGSTPPSARGVGGMVWPAIGGRDAPRETIGTPREGANGHGMRERDGSGGSPVSISISAPLLDGHGLGLAPSAGMNGSGTVGYVHTRSHSFTPKLSSRLAGLGAASPGRKGSAGEVDPGVEREKEKRVVFPFHFGGGAGQTKPLPSMPGPPDTGAAPLLAPPHIILEPASPSNPHDMRNSSLLLAPSTDANDSKRASQIVYAAGFVNRLVTPALADPRAWKAFKMEVRGTKLVLHKPPGDRTAGVRELFPQGVVDDAEDEEAAAAAAQEDGAGQRRDVGSVGRKKRAFWGRGRHPALGVRGAGAAALGGVFGVEGGASLLAGVEKGTVEALVHELVFATVFLHADCAPDEEARREEAWRDYALAVLLCLPMLAGRARVETEFIRCAGYLISGAVPEESESTRKRVAWMAGEYLRLHGAPADADAWEDFRAEALPDVYFPTPQPVTSGMPASSSTQAIYAPSPLIGAGSPTLGPAPFSPRPNAGDARMVGLLDALGFRDTTASPSSATTSPQSPQPSRAGLSSRMPWAGLQTEGLSRDVLLALDPHIIARSLTLFHRAVLEQAPDHPTAAFLNPGAGGPSSPLFGSDVEPHWLTKLLLVQILGADTSAGTVYAGAPINGEQQPATTSRTHSRSEVITVWARVGELCRAAGDECSWRAIVAALCSAPIARLDKVWRRVEPTASAAVEGWARMEGEGSEVRAPRVTPWGGNIRQRFKDEVDVARANDGSGAEETLLVAPMERAFDMFEGFRKQFLLCPRRVSLAEDEVGEDMKLMVKYWREKYSEGGGSGGIAAKFVRVDQFMSLSLAAEPRRKGLFEPHYWTRAANQTPYASLIPLLFPEVFPTSSLVDRAGLLRGRVDSDTDPRLLRLDQQQLPQQTRRDFGGLAGLGQTGTVIPVYNGEVLLSVWHGSPGDSAASSRPSSRLPSRPPSSVVDGVESSLSRGPSVRVKPGSSQGLDRKTSLARRSSLPALSQRRTFIAAEPSSEPPLRVRVLAGTLNWLVDILVHGLQNVSVSVADDNGEMSLRETKTRELVVDQAEFSKLWWNVYRSLVTPLVFFELLRKMYLQTRPQGPVPSVADLLYIAGSRTEVFDILSSWLMRGGGAQDILDDTQLYTAVCSFLDNSSDHVLPKSANANDPGVEQAWSTLKDVRHRLRRTFTSHTMRPAAPFPSLNHPPSAGLVSGQRGRPSNQSREPPDIDRIDPEELVDNLDALAAAAFGNVTEEDLFITSDLLEVQTADRIGWFLPFPPSDETVEIQNMYSYLQEIEPSPLISELGQESLYRLLPPGVRSCIRAYVILRKWTISQLVAPRLGLRARQSRMELILRAIEVTRLRNLPNHVGTPQSIVDVPCGRSFVEAVLTSAVLSVESRMHHRPWLNIAMSRGAHCDSIASLLSQPATQAISSSRELTLDVGWFFERMLEILAAPDVINSIGQQDGFSLINFDKRRHLCTLIASIPKGAHREDDTRKAFERLNNIEKDVWMLQFDHRGIKEEAQREGTLGPGSSPAAARRAVRPFQKTIAVQLEKNRRDRTIRSRLHKERVQEQTKHEKREDLLNRAMRKQPATPQNKHQRGKKSMSAFLHFMRPISSAFGNESVHTSGLKRTAEELDFVPSGKPSLVISLVEARVAQFINNDRSFTFQLDTEDGGHYLLQAVNKREMTKWVDTINRVTQTAAKRRLTYIGNSPRPQLADHLHDGPVAASRDPLAVFGVDLNFLLRREMGTDDIPPGTIPSLIERCLAEIEARGLTEVGIYRLAGAASVITALKEAFNRGVDPIDASTDIHAVCDLVKSWFRVLPEPLFPSTDYHLVIEAMHLENLDDRLTSIRNVVQGLPRPNFDLLKRVSEHLDKVADFEEYNQMTAEGLAIVFSPNLLRAPQENFAMILANMGHTHKLVKALITHFHVIFDEGDAEAEGDAEEGEEAAGDEEVDSPTHLEDVAEDEDEDDFRSDVPPTITANLDHSPLDFSTFSYTLPT